MNPSIALILCSAFIIYLFWVDIKSRPSVSIYLWVPWLWFVIWASRPLSYWFGGAGNMESPDAILEGSPIDRVVFLGLTVIGFFVLFKNKEKLVNVFKKNILITIFLLYMGLSTLWSDFTYVSFKRWIKEVGNFTMILIILTEYTPSEAFKTLIKRLAYLLIPLSMLFNKYFPELGRMWSIGGGPTQYTGVTSHKNSLGMLAMICGFVLLWNLLSIIRDNSKTIDKKDLFVHLSLMALIVWLLYMANSATSVLCSIVGAIMIFVLNMKKVRANIKMVKYYVAIAAVIFIVLHLSLDITDMTTKGLGRDDTLTGRTVLWEEILAMKTNPLLGTGYQSFWLGERYEFFWNRYWWRPNQAHNGYLELYINLGYIGLVLFLICVLKATINISKNLKNMHQYEYQIFRLTLISVFLLLSFTEAYFIGFIWLVLLFAMFEPAHPQDFKTPIVSTGAQPVINTRYASGYLDVRFEKQ